jgi:prepilin-type N-terminal cleavage/methylation domain-containing protein
MSNRHRRGFTLVELLVVIGVIALLVGILVPVVTKVRQTAYVANTKNLMQKISAACTSYQLVFHSAPGVMPNKDYDFDYTSPTPGPVFVSNNFNATEQPTWKYFTQSEDLVVALSGGLWRNLTDPASKVSFDAQYLGQGPTSFNPLNPGKSAAFIAADPSDLSPIPPGKTIKAAPDLTLADPANGLNQTFVKDSMVPEFMDKFPDPRAIIYVRANPGAVNGSTTAGPQIISPSYNPAYHYNYRALAPYLNYQDTGEVLNQPPPIPNTTGTNDPPPTVKYFMSEQSNTTARYAGTYILISAGLDRKFGTADDIISGGGGAN